MAEIYFFGLGQQRDYSKALHWYQNVEGSEAEFMLGIIYFNGLGVKKDYVKAYHYFNLSQSRQFDSLTTLNPLIEKQQEKFMFSNDKEKETARLNKIGLGKSDYSTAAQIKKEFLDKKLTAYEINKAQNLEIK